MAKPIQLHLRLLGPLAVELSTRPTPKISRKTRAILAYLAVTGKRHSRRSLMDTFCQETADPAGALRWHLSRIRRQLGQEILHVSSSDIGINGEVVWCDHHEFQQIMSAPAAQDHAALHLAFSRYRGEFLEDLDLRNSPVFNMWLLGERTRFRQYWENGTQVLISRLIGQRQFAQARDIAQMLLQHNALLEPVQTQLIWLYAQMGQRESALQQYEQCRELLWRELAVAPSLELSALHEAILQQQALAPLEDAALFREEKAPDTAVPGFIGRQEERRRLVDMWRQGGGVLLVEAAAGGGKTRLLEAFRQDLPAEVCFLCGYSYESTRSIPYQPWLPILHNFLASQDLDFTQALALHWQQQLGLLLPNHFPAPVGTPNQQQLFRAIAYLLMESAVRRPMLILLEDLQWADEASLQLFHFIVQQAPANTEAFMLVGTFRTEEVADEGALPALLRDLARTGVGRIALPPFTAVEVGELITQVWPDWDAAWPVSAMRDTLHQAAGGNPLFTSEVLQELAATAAPPAALPLPPSLVALTERRLGQLTASGRQVIESLAVLDRPAHFDLAQQVSARSEEETLGAIEMGLRWRLLRADERTQFDFSHHLLRTAVVAQLSPVRRVILHRRAANTLNQRGADPATLAFHWGQAGDEDQEATFAAQAGTAAAALYANGEAMHYFERVLALRPSAQTWRQLGDVQRRIGQWEQARHAYEQALQLVAGIGDFREQAVVHLSLGKLLVARGDYLAAQTHLRIAETTFQDHDQPAELADIYNNQAIIAYRQGDYDTALAKYKNALQIDRFLEDEAGMAIRLGNMGLVYLNQSKLEQAEVLLQQSLQLARQLQHQEYIANRLGNLGIVASVRGDFDGALHLYRQAVAIDEALGNQQAVARHIGNMGIEYHRKRDASAALTHWFEALTREQAMGNVRAEARLLGNLGAVYQEIGDYELGERCLALALDMDLAAGHRDAIARHCGNLAHMYHLQNLGEQAARWVQPALVLTRQLQDLPHLAEYLLTAAQLEAAAGRLDVAEAYARECLSLGQRESRPDHFLSAQIMTIFMQVRQQSMRGAVGLTRLQTMLTEWPSTNCQALIFDAIWQLDPGQVAARDQAIQLYTAAHHDFPQALSRQRVRALGGPALPSPEFNPPPGVLAIPPELGILYQQVVDLLPH